MSGVPKCSEKQWDGSTEQTKLFLCRHFPGDVSPQHAAAEQQQTLQAGGSSPQHAEQAMRGSPPPSSSVLLPQQLQQGPYRFTTHQLCCLVLVIPLSPVSQRFPSNCVSQRTNLHAGASFLAPQNNSTTVSTFQSIFFLQRSTTSAAKGHSIIRRSSAWKKYKSCKNYALCGEAWCCF